MSISPPFTHLTGPLSEPFLGPLLFCSWLVSDNGSYAWSFIVVMFMGLGRHILAFLRKEVAAANANVVDDGTSEDLLPAKQTRLTWIRRRLTVRFLQKYPIALKLVDALIFGANATLGFLNMLVVMTYNPGIMMAVVLGEVIGVLMLENPGGAAAAGLEVEQRDLACH